MRILIHRLGSLGDTVVALPCFHLIRQTYPSAYIAVLTNTPVSTKAAPLESILENTGLIDTAFYYPMGSRDIPALARLHSELRKQHFDLFISLSIGRHLPTCVRDYLFFKTCGIPRIIGMPWAKRDRICQPLNGGPDYEPEARRLLRRIRGLGSLVDQLDPNEPRWTDLRLTETERAQAKRLLDEIGITGKFIVSSLGTKSPLKDWGTENWSQLFAQLSSVYPQLPLVMLGSDDEFARSETVLKSWRGPRGNLSGMATPRVSAAILRNAQLFIGHDSGPAHLAAAVGTRCITIYSAYAPPGQWFPLGQGHIPLYPYSFYHEQLRNDPNHQREALLSIPVADVLSAARRGLDQIC